MFQGSTSVGLVTIKDYVHPVTQSGDIKGNMAISVEEGMIDQKKDTTRMGT